MQRQRWRETQRIQDTGQRDREQRQAKFTKGCITFGGKSYTNFEIVQNISQFANFCQYKKCRTL